MYDGGYIYHDGTNTSGVTPTFNDNADTDIVGCAVDLDNNKIYWHVNGTYITYSSTQQNPNTSTHGYSIVDPGDSANHETGFYSMLALTNGGGSDDGVAEVNFGNPSFSISSGNSDANGYGNFEYAVPSGYYALCTKNLAEYG